MAVVLPVLLDVNVISLVFPPPGAAVQDQVPVPTLGSLPPRAALVEPLHTDKLPPLVDVVGAAVTIIVPDAVAIPQSGVIKYSNVPDCVGVPLIVMVLLA